MHIFRHYHITQQHEMVASSDLFENVHQQLSVSHTAQQRQPLITAGGDEMAVSRAVVAVQPVGHAVGVA